MVEEFLEDINNLLNSGEVPGLFEKDELEQVLAATRPKAKEAGISEENRDEVETKPEKIKKHVFIDSFHLPLNQGHFTKSPKTNQNVSSAYVCM